MEKDVLVLDGTWEFKEFPETARRMRDLDGGNWMPAAVPSSIYTCLSQAGQIDAADLTANPENFHWVSDKSWIFRRTFDVPAALLEKEQVTLVFEGLDTVSQVLLNGKLIGKTDNMFIPHSFDVTGRLKPANNVVMVKFSPALKHADQLMQRYGKLSEHHFGDLRRSYLRKAQYQFGSVMAPPLIGCGIFRSVRLQGHNTARIEHLHIRTVDCDTRSADVRIALEIERTAPRTSSLLARIRLTGHGRDIVHEAVFAPQERRHTTLIHIDNPALWWPRGYGQPHQYTLCVELYEAGRLLDTAAADLGIRTIRLDRSADERGSKFQFIVNDQPIAVKGANWVPLTIFPGSQVLSDYTCMLDAAAETHLNMLRVWAGGFYETAEFYSQCDQRGLLVWQDFMFASAYYPDRQWFSDMVRREVRAVIERLRNHACLALWCGNSRIDSLHEDGRLGTGRKFYGKAIYHTLIPSLLSELDPDREYIPTTPFSQTPSAGCNDPASGTTHTWNVWNQYADPAEYEMPDETIPRFVAEFGLQSIPDVRTLSAFGPHPEQASGAFAMDKHNYQPGGRQRIARYVADDFVPASDLPQAVRQSQLAQARAVKRYVEHLRSHPGANSGCLLWTLNEPAPSVGFSMVDACGRPKALFYYARRFFAPVLVALTSSGQMTAQRVAVVNDGPQRITGTLDCRILDFAGNVLDQTHIPVALSPFSRSALYPVPKSLMRSARPRTSLLHLHLVSEGSTMAENLYFFQPEKYLQAGDGDVELHIETIDSSIWQVTLRADTVIRDLQVIAPRPARLSDNFVTLLPGQPQTITIQFADAAPPIYTPLHILTGTGV